MRNRSKFTFQNFLYFVKLLYVLCCFSWLLSIIFIEVRSPCMEWLLLYIKILLSSQLHEKTTKKYGHRTQVKFSLPHSKQKFSLVSQKHSSGNVFWKSSQDPGKYLRWRAL